MSIVSLTPLLQDAWKNQYAIGHFNVNNLEFAQAILRAAQSEQSPVILAVSEGYIRYLGGLKTAAAMIKALVEDLTITVPVAIHLDHGSSVAVCVKAMHAGFTSVMIDASHLSLEENIAQTKRVVEFARPLGVSVEAELGRIGGKEDDLVVEEAEAMYAVTSDCVQLVQETAIDSLAPALGSVHGPYKGKPNLGFARMEEIQKATGIPLVLHGGTGIPDDDIRRAIAAGTAKINVNTENQMACTAAVRTYLQENPNEYDPRTYLGFAKEAVMDQVRAKIRLFGSAGTV